MTDLIDEPIVDIDRQFLLRYDGLRAQGLNKKQMSEQLGIKAETLPKLIKKHNKPQPLTTAEVWGNRVREYIESNGGTIKGALAALGSKSTSHPKVVRNYFKKVGFDPSRYIYKGITLGCYRGGVISEEEAGKRWGIRRIPVTCLQCGSEHLLLVSQFSAGKNAHCSECPSQERNRRLFLIVETQECFETLSQVHREFFSHEIHYLTLRRRLLTDGFCKSKDGSITVTLANNENDRAIRIHSASRSEGGSNSVRPSVYKKRGRKVIH